MSQAASPSVAAHDPSQVVTADAALVPPVTALCAATGTCTTARALITAAECVLRHAVHFLMHGAPAEVTLCKTFHACMFATDPDQVCS